MKKLLVTILLASFLVSSSFGFVKSSEAKSAGAKPPLEKKVFIHYKKSPAKPEKPGRDKAPSCYGFLAGGAKWKNLPINFVVQDISMRKPVLAAVNEWDDHTEIALFDGYAVDSEATWDDVSPDGKNEFVFGNYPQEGVIAITIAWGYFSAPKPLRQIVEFDVLFDTDFDWGDGSINPELMDLQNIATHEIGHGLGLGDVYQSACNEVTMYGYSTEGELDKRTLESPDIKGLLTLYP